MRRWLCVICIVLSLFMPLEVKAEETVEVSAVSAILIDTNSGRVLYEKGSQDAHQCGGMARLMAALTAMDSTGTEVQYSNPDGRTFTISTGVLGEGSSYARDDLVRAVMVGGYDDCGYALSLLEDDFVGSMNAKASSIGMNGSHFTDSYDAGNGECVTTAHDLATLAQEILAYDTLSPLFKEAIGQLGDMTYTRTLVSYEGLNGQYDASTGEGWISLVSTARSNTRFIACVMGESDVETAHNDIVKLLDYGYANYKSVTMTKDSVGTKEVELQDGEEIKQFTFYLASDLFALMPSSADESLLRTEVVLVDENDPDRIQAYVAIHMGDEEIGRITMQKNVTVLNPKTPLEMVYTYFSYGCMAVAAVGIILFVFKHASRAVKPSE